MPTTLIAFNEPHYLAAKARIEEKAALIQEIVDSFNGLGLAALTPGEFNQLITNPKKLVFDKMTAGQPLEISGNQITESKAIELLEKPNGYEAFLAKIEEVFNLLKNEFVVPLNYPVDKSNFTHFFDLNGLGQVVLKATMDNKIAESFKTYAVSDAANKMLSFAQTIAAYVNENDIKKAAGDGKTIGQIVDSIIDSRNSVLDQGSQPVQLKVEGIARYNTSLYKA